MPEKNLVIDFKRGLITLSGNVDTDVFPSVRFDKRLKTWVTSADNYRDIVVQAYQGNYTLDDKARAYKPLNLSLIKEILPRKHQSIALQSWLREKKRGCCVLPTGAGKTILAILAIAEVKRQTLIVVPTIDLLNQWQGTIHEFFGISAGGYGGGEKSLSDITVATYDSAKMIIEYFGDRFGFLIFDECHHLPAPLYQLIAKSSLAPFRLGLTATIERADGGEELIYELIGPKVYEAKITDMTAKVLAPYDVVTVEVSLDEKERNEYERNRSVYLDFLRSCRINFSNPGAWQEFIKVSARSNRGRMAMSAYRLQKKLANGAKGKIRYLWKIFSDHVGERIIIFTNDNSLAYDIGRRYLLPVLTHHTKSKERKKMLASFREGSVTVLVTSKVLNEGVDVPEASVGVVVSGSGSVREHVQRLGRILRHQKGKSAKLYELISKDTNESHVKERRRQHHAYQKSP